MNSLVKELIRPLLEDNQKITAVYGGGFKPPIKGHFGLVQKALKDLPEIDDFIIYVGGGVRDGITQEQAMEIWGVYQEVLGPKVQIEPSAQPIRDVISYAKNHPDEKVYFVIGYREGREDDLQDIASRTKGVEEKYPNLEVKVIKTSDPEVSGTNARKALQKGDKEAFFTFLPDEIPANEKEQIYNIVTKAIVREADPKTGTGKKPKGSGRRLYTDEDPNDTVSVKFSTKQDIIDTLSKSSFKSKSHARQSQIINLIHQRVRAAYERAKDPEVKKRLKTALDYAEQRKEASKEKTQRLKKENVAPNHTGKSSPFGSGYKPLKENTIPSIDILEKIAELTNYMREKGYNIDPVPSITIVDDDVENAGKFLGKTAYYNPTNKSITLYTYGRHPKDIVRSFSHEMIHHIQNLEGRIGNGDIKTTNTNEDDYLKKIEAEANLKGTMTFRSWTDSLKEEKNKDPFGLNQYARELAQGLEETLNEGRYDKFTNELSRLAFELIKDGYDVGRKVVDETFTVGPADEDPDIVSNDFEFDFNVQATYTDDNYKVDGGANAGFDDEGDEITPLLTVRFKIPKNIDWQKVSFDLKDVVRHELEHLTQDGANIRSGKQMDDDAFIRKMIDANLLPKSDYFKLEKEVDAMLQGMYLKAKKSKRPFKDVIDDYLALQPITPEEKEQILDLWRKRNKALNLSVFEVDSSKDNSYLGNTGDREKGDEMGKIGGKKPVIFCDMDGVLVDFDKGYKDLTGMTTHHADAQGKKEFWKVFRDGLKNSGETEEYYWANLDWQPGGKELWDYISPYKPYVLTAPAVNFDFPEELRYSREHNESIKGKLDWVQRLPNMKKIYFASAKNKAKFSRPNHILIDDRKDTIDAWNVNGGIGILHTSAANTIKQLEELGL